MSTIVGFYGGPGTGKSTTAAKTFALLKEQGENTELVTEYVKQWAWENREPVNYDQFYFFGKQARKEYCLFGKVDTIVTDSPVVLNGVYAQIHGTALQATVFRSMVFTYLDMVKNNNHNYVHIFLERVKPYSSNGRYQTEEQAKQIDLSVLRYLRELGIEPHHVKADETAHQKIFELLQMK